MTEPLLSRPTLDEHDLATVRQLYGEAQQWTRHYEGLVVNANVLLISSSLIFVGLAFGDGADSRLALVALGAPLAFALVGMLLTQTLFRLYATCIRRMIRLENLLNCYDPKKFAAIDGEGSLLEPSLMRLPVVRPASVRFFMVLYGLLSAAYLVLIAIRPW